MVHSLRFGQVDNARRSWKIMASPKRLDYRRDGWFAFRFATRPWRSITRERLPRQRWSVDGKRVQLTVQNSHYPTFVGKGKVSWPDGSPTQRKISLSCPAGRIVVSAHIWISHGNGGSGLAHTQRADGTFHNHHDHALRASDARAQAGSGKEARAVQCRAVVCPVRAEGVPTKVPTVGNQLRSSALLNY